jgi:hypothetical protein
MDTDTAADTRPHPFISSSSSSAAAAAVACP